ncbi:hypothetical protein PN498_24540 [Oscillatoria sp. CS-180]|uniref:hypothetical protein n=1 Tax=Oscillatoria sp. CS-180 TaxID=3021720 RepID=UPI00232E3FD0|nr:hypothetical protein [Oscillatoria sp. CS-180]MDB9529183.1 hypothetical protein [Oscillatoria sp. CS-180]
MSSTAGLHHAAILDKAVQGFTRSGVQRPNGRTLTAALLEQERSTKQAKQAISLESLLGTWRLCFSAGKQAKFQSGEPIGSGFYVPKLAIARISFSSDDSNDAPLTIANQLNVGPLHIRFTGPARYLGKKNLLMFDFTHLRVTCFGLTAYQGTVNRQKRADKPFEETTIAQLPFFAFFAVANDYIAARGRGGGLALWVKE